MRENRYFKGLELESIVESVNIDRLTTIEIDESTVPSTPEALIESVKACVNEMKAVDTVVATCLNEAALFDKLKNAWKIIKDFFIRIWNSIMGFFNRILKRKPRIAKGPIVNPDNIDKGASRPSQANVAPNDEPEDALDKFGSNSRVNMKDYMPMPANEPFVIRIKSGIYARYELYSKYKEKYKALGMKENIFELLKKADNEFIDSQVRAYEQLNQAVENGEFSEDKLGDPIYCEYNGLDESSKNRALIDFNRMLELAGRATADFTIMKHNMTKHGDNIKVDIKPEETGKLENILYIVGGEKNRFGLMYQLIAPIIAELESIKEEYIRCNLLNI